jgi:riboflavin kinase/FMN adenylyltransferase
MRVVRDIENLPAELRGAAVAIGNFDGLHNGHRAVLNVMRARAEALRAKRAVVTFEPHPRKYFDAGNPPKRLTRVSEKLRLLRDAGVEIVYVLRFNQALAELPAEQFIHTILVEKLGVKDVATGEDFVFGKGRLGSVKLIAAGAEFSGKYTANIAPPILHAMQAVSSSRIRKHLAAGEVAEITPLLGRPYVISGRVIEGDKRARGLGYPTANVALPPYHATPAFGVYIIEAQAVDKNGQGLDVWHRGIANIGVRPTFGKDTRPLLEVHLLQGSHALYGQIMTVRFEKFLRPEKKFETTAALAAQIARDATTARAYWAALDKAREEAEEAERQRTRV